MKRTIIIAFTILCYTAINSCSNNTDNAAATEEKSHGHIEDNHVTENTATLTEEQIKTIGIEFGTIEPKELTHAIKANGLLTVPNQNKAFVTPLYAGVVKTLNVQPGTVVKQGETIATIVNPELTQMQQQLQQVNTQIALSEIEVKRQKELVEGNAAPLKKLQQAETELATLKSQRTGLQKLLSGVGASQEFSSVIVIKAPISGVISKVSAQLGSNVNVNTPIAEIVNNSQLHLDLFIYEKDLSLLKTNQVIHFTITNNPGKEYDAEIFSIGAAFEEGSKTIPVHARVKGDKTGLIDGMSVTALVSLDKSTVPAIPTNAIVSYQGGDYIFVVTGAHTPEGHLPDSAKTGNKGNNSNSEAVTFEKIPVAKGKTDVGFSEITLLKNIPEHAKIVTKGAFFILAKMTNVESDDH